MDKFINTPRNFIPTLGTQARQLLELLWDGQDHSSKEIMKALECDPRSPVQSLRTDWGYWLIHNTGTKQGRYQLDERHLSGIAELDRQARIEAELTYNEASLRQADRESRRKPKAFLNLEITKEKFRAEIQLEFDL